MRAAWLATALIAGLLAPAHADQPAPAAKARALDLARIRVYEDAREALRRFEFAAMAHADRVHAPGEAHDALVDALVTQIVERRRALAEQVEKDARATVKNRRRMGEGFVLAAGLFMDVFDSISRLAEVRGRDPAETDAATSRNEALRLWQAVVDEAPTYPDLGLVLDDLSQTYYDLGDYEQAKRALQRMLCANRDNELAAAATAVDNADDGLKARVYAQSVGVESYAGCQPRVTDAELEDDAWLRLAYLHPAAPASAHCGRAPRAPSRCAAGRARGVAGSASSPGWR
jgi:tetratricopeptide (TPR) repeat protein